MVYFPKVFGIVYAEEYFDEGNSYVVDNMPKARLFPFDSFEQAMKDFNDRFYNFNDHSIVIFLIQTATNEYKKYVRENGSFLLYQ
jgi:hypothetical protein